MQLYIARHVAVYLRERPTANSHVMLRASFERGGRGEQSVCALRTPVDDVTADNSSSAGRVPLAGGMDGFLFQCDALR